MAIGPSGKTMSSIFIPFPTRKSWDSRMDTPPTPRGLAHLLSHARSSGRLLFGLSFWPVPVPEVWPLAVRSKERTCSIFVYVNLVDWAMATAADSLTRPHLLLHLGGRMLYTLYEYLPVTQIEKLTIYCAVIIHLYKYRI